MRATLSVGERLKASSPLVTASGVVRWSAQQQAFRKYGAVPLRAVTETAALCRQHGLALLRARAIVRPESSCCSGFARAAACVLHAHACTAPTDVPTAESRSTNARNAVMVARVVTAEKYRIVEIVERE